ncbi:MAG: MATE family efflux transporter [Spirochaetia bacterium]|nr:MATE family efflux transporter [Spirochaetia bacterium]
MFIMVMVATGISSGLVMLAAQYWGKKDYESIRTLHGIALRISASFGLLFSILTACIPGLIMRIFTEDENLIQTGASYLRGSKSFLFLFFNFSGFSSGIKKYRTS